ncbi:hypothetical protein OIU79_024420 [Salix purpurea]|uniref:Uncharacterized protein n=1 Tax=Salix purpurea TaxID=77065 RepID=A0A9Q0WAZ0_SALPP|nr:hypothetical protein OIU79_024420 [Salix purpurea]
MISHRKLMRKKSMERMIAMAPNPNFQGLGKTGRAVDDGLKAQISGKDMLNATEVGSTVETPPALLKPA